MERRAFLQLAAASPLAGLLGPFSPIQAAPVAPALPERFPTGLPGLDRLLEGGLKGGEIYGLAGFGKTTLLSMIRQRNLNAGTFMSHPLVSKRFGLYGGWRYEEADYEWFCDHPFKLLLINDLALNSTEYPTALTDSLRVLNDLRSLPDPPAIVLTMKYHRSVYPELNNGLLFPVLDGWFYCRSTYGDDDNFPTTWGYLDPWLLPSRVTPPPGEGYQRYRHRQSWRRERLDSKMEQAIPRIRVGSQITLESFSEQGAF